MEVLLLGTSGGPGWPNPHCRCPSCQHARSTGVFREPTAALVDGQVLLDLGPSVGRAAHRAGVDLAEVSAVLVTHAHSDHLDPSLLLYRSWVNESPLEVIGPAPVIESCQHWLDPAGSPIRLREVSAGQRTQVAGYDVLVLPATHEALGPAVLCDVTDASGARLLYATDTGPWSDAALELMAGRRYDLVLLEETFGDQPLSPGHHTIETFGVAVSQLREVGAVDAATDVIAVHLGHLNPALPQLEARLAVVGARVVPDLTKLALPGRKR